MAVLNQQARTNRAVVSQEQKKRIDWLQGRMLRVKNQMDFVEIISNFLPVGSMDGKVSQLEREMNVLNQQFSSLLNGQNPFRV